MDYPIKFLLSCFAVGLVLTYIMNYIIAT